MNRLPRSVSVLLILSLSCVCSGCPSEHENNVTPVDAGSDVDDPDTPEGFAQAFEPARLGWGLHVIARDVDDIYVAGGTPDRGTLLHFDGDEWAAEVIPEVPLLNWVAPFVDGQTAVVGNGGTVLWNDGSSGWEEHQTPTEEDLWGVWGASSDDVWAVGGRGREEGQATVLRYDGSDWVEVEVPALQRSGVNAYFKVWGTDADNVYVVGQNGAVLHWDGTQIAEEDAGTSEDLISLWGTAPDDIIAVGGRNNGVLAHFDGTAWRSESISPAPGVNGVWMSGPGEFWIAGVRGMLRKGTVTADGFDVPRTPPLTDHELHAVFGVDDYGLMIVGGNFQARDGPYEGTALVKSGDSE